MKMDDSTRIIHGDIQNDSYLLVEDTVKRKLLIVHSDYFYQESAVLFELAFGESDWSEGMIVESAKMTVDYLNSVKFYPSASF
jgi:choline kinase